jgi:hypothetical protein
VFAPDADSRKPGKFVLAGHDGMEDKALLRMLAAE